MLFRSPNNGRFVTIDGVDQFISYDGVWTGIKYITNPKMREDCANAARCAWLDLAYHYSYCMVRSNTEADKAKFREAHANADAWAAWGRATKGNEHA